MNRLLAALAWIHLLCMLAPELALATTYGNLTRKYAAGHIDFGLMSSQTTREFESKLSASTSAGDVSASGTGDLDIAQQSILLRYGLSETAAIGLVVGNVEYKDESSNKLSGQEFGGMFWSQLKSGADGVNTGVMLGYRGGSVSNRYYTGNTTQIDLAFGGAKSISDQAAVYVNLVYSKLEQKLKGKENIKQVLADELAFELGFPVTVNSFNQDLTSSQTVLLVFGTEVLASPTVAITLEVHAMAETGFALGLTAGF